MQEEWAAVRPNEPPLGGAVPAVLGAVYDAISVAPTTLPCHPERVWRMMGSSDARS